MVKIVFFKESLNFTETSIKQEKTKNNHTQKIMLMNTHLLKKTLQEVWEESALYDIYCFVNFTRIIGKIYLVERFSQDESHPWLSPPIETMSIWQFQKCMNYINEVAPKKKHVSI